MRTPENTRAAPASDAGPRLPKRALASGSFDKPNTNDDELQQLTDKEILALEFIAERGLIIAGAGAVLHMARLSDTATVEGYLY